MNPVLAHLLDAVSLAPSAHNTQPWGLTWTGAALEFRIRPDRRLTAIDPHDAEALHGLGAALESALLTLAQLGYRGSYTVAGAFDPVAPLVTLTWAATSDPRPDPTLYRMIPVRRTARVAYSDALPPAPAIDTLAAAVHPPCGLSLLTDPVAVRRVRRLVGVATAAQLRARATTRELYDWLRFTPSDPRWRRDGLTAACMGWGWLTARAARVLLHPLAVRVVGGLGLRGLVYGGTDANAAAAPALALLTVTADTIAARVEAGRTLQRVWLIAAAHGLATHPISAAVDVPATRDEVLQLLEIPAGVIPVNLFRIGFAPPTPRSPRVPVDELLDGPPRAET
jgi:nitroreductase